MKYYPADAIIIKAMDYGESHRIFTFFSKEEGKFSAIARGVKKPKSTMRGHLQLGNRCNLLFYRGKSLDTVSQAEATETYPHIRSHPKAYLYASYFMELINAALPEREPQKEIFALLHESFLALDTEIQSLVARYFEIRLMAEIGYDTDFRHCIHCGKGIKEGFLSPRFEGVICEHCGSGYPVSPQAIYALNYYRKTPADQVHRLKVNGETEKMMAKTTKHILNYHLDRKLKSLEILEETLIHD